MSVYYRIAWALFDPQTLWVFFVFNENKKILHKRVDIIELRL